EPTYSPVEIRGLGLFQIGEEAPNPRREMLLEQFAIGTGGSGGGAAPEPPPELRQDRRRVLRARLGRDPVHCEALQLPAPRRAGAQAAARAGSQLGNKIRKAKVPRARAQ